MNSLFNLTWSLQGICLHLPILTFSSVDQFASLARNEFWLTLYSRRHIKIYGIYVAWFLIIRYSRVKSVIWSVKSICLSRKKVPNLKCIIKEDLSSFTRAQHDLIELPSALSTMAKTSLCLLSDSVYSKDEKMHLQL